MSIRDKVEHVFDAQNSRIAKLENALHFYANVDNYFGPSDGDWDTENPSNVELDNGERARKVLYGD